MKKSEISSINKILEKINSDFTKEEVWSKIGNREGFGFDEEDEEEALVLWIADNPYEDLTEKEEEEKEDE